MRPDPAITAAKHAKALAHPLRLQILGVLEGRIASPKEIAAELDASLGVVSYHVRVLSTAGFIELVRTRPRRGATEHYYRAVVGSAATSAGQLLRGTHAGRAVVGTLAKVSADLSVAARMGGFARSDAHLTRSPLVLDDQAFAQVAAMLDRLLADLERICASAERRLERRDRQGEIRATAVLMLFETPPMRHRPRTDQGRADPRSRSNADV